ncbi:hypothetical protein D3C72_810460 [compost metagenome]
MTKLRSSRYPPEEYVATSVSTAVLANANAAHQRQRIAVMSGPPGIGKSKAIEALRKALSGSCVIAKVGGKDIRATAALQAVAIQLRRLSDPGTTSWVPAGRTELQRHIFASMCAARGLNSTHAHAGVYQRETFGRMTVVFDEAQSLSRDAIEALRFLSEPDSQPIPFGLVFIGNAEFAMAPKGDRKSVLTAAVEDRAAYVEEFHYADVLDDDLILYAEARGVVETATLDAIIDFFGPDGPAREIRSLRKLGQAIDGAIEDVVDDDIGPDLIIERLTDVMRLRLPPT